MIYVKGKKRKEKNEFEEKRQIERNKEGDWKWKCIKKERWRRKKKMGKS